MEMARLSRAAIPATGREGAPAMMKKMAPSGMRRRTRSGETEEFMID
jgi:hypothetical protein